MISLAGNPLKQEVYKRCLQLLDEKISGLEAMMKGLNESAANETKSSAGDKHETGRAMVQLEQENLGKQLDELLEQKEQLQKIDTGQVNNKVVKGSLVKTDRTYLFLGIALGKITVDGSTVMVISPKSPLGMKLLGLKEMDSAEINGIKYVVEKID